MSTATATNPFQLKASAGGGSYDLCPSGSHLATLIGIIDLGTHDDDYQGKAREAHKVLLAWELSGEIKPDGSPFVMTKEFSLYFSPKAALRIMIEGWRGRAFAEGEDFDLSAMLGKPCQVNVIHKKTSKGNDAHEIKAVSSVPKGTTVPRPHHDTLMYTVDDGQPPDLEWLPWHYGEPVADIIKRSKELTGKPIGAGTPAAPPAPKAGDDDDIPF